MTKFLRQPPSIRLAASVIVVATTVVVVGSGVLIRVLDHREYSSIWLGMWWALQTVTTVGYGDVTPKDVAGRIVGGLVMLEGIAFLAIITAVITSSFVARAEREHALAERAEEGSLDARMDDIAQRLGRLESLIRDLGSR
jgi:voltage-gated potassium channel